MTAFDLWLCKRILHPQSISSNDRLKAAVGVRQRKCVLSWRECQSRDVMPVAPGCHAGCIRQERDFPNGVFKAKCFDPGCGFRAGQRPGVGFEQHFNVHVLDRGIAPEDRQIEGGVLQIGLGIDRLDLEAKCQGLARVKSDSLGPSHREINQLWAPTHSGLSTVDLISSITVSIPPRCRAAASLRRVPSAVRQI